MAYAKYAGQLCGILGTEAARTMFQHLIALTSDKVPNVKIVAANNIVLALKTQKQLSTVSSSKLRPSEKLRKPPSRR